MVNSATGDAASANSQAVFCTGAGKVNSTADATPPSTMAQGMGLVTTPFKALRTASSAPPLAPSSRDSAMHSELVMTMSTTISTITGPTLRGPSRAASNGTPMKPVLGNAATKAPKEASFQPMRSLNDTTTANPTITSAQNR